MAEKVPPPKLLIAILIASLAVAAVVGATAGSVSARAAIPSHGKKSLKKSRGRTHGSKQRRCRRCVARPAPTRSGVASRVIASAPTSAVSLAPSSVVTPVPSSTSSPAGVTTQPAPLPGREAVAPSSESIYLGATIGGSVYGESNPPWDMKPLQTFESHSGHSVAILQVHQEWGQIYPDVLESIQRRGAVPMLITAYENLHEIVDGSQDAEIKAMNAALTSYGGPVLLRWDWEMNGDWYPWGGQNQAQEWVAAYRHLHDVLTAPNVSWVWNPNVYSPGQAPGAGAPADPAAWFPGSSYVDWMGADGYSYGTETFAEVFGPTYELFQELAPNKPIILPEWAASNQGGRKAAYIREAFEQVPTYFPAIKAMVYYNDTLGEGRDWPLEDLPAAESAYQAGSAQSAFSATPNLVGKLAVP